MPTPTKLSKHERRQLFEAQVKARDEMVEMQKYMMAQQTQHADPAATYPPGQYYPTPDPAYADPNLPNYGMTPMHGKRTSYTGKDGAVLRVDFKIRVPTDLEIPEKYSWHGQSWKLGQK